MRNSKHLRMELPILQGGPGGGRLDLIIIDSLIDFKK